MYLLYCGTNTKIHFFIYFFLSLQQAYTFGAWTQDFYWLDFDESREILYVFRL